MITIIDDRYEAQGEPYLVFKVYQEADDNTVYGYLISHSEYDANGKLQFVKTPYGIPVNEAFMNAIQKAEAFGHDFKISHLWVQDLDGLFPPEKRHDIPVLEQPMKQAS